jgi:pyruvate kinase
LQDLQGPRIRVGNLPDAGVELVRGQKLVLSFGRTRRLGADCIPVDLTTAPRLRAGNKILIHDGLVELKVISQKGNEVNCQVIRGGSIFSHKGVNIPNVKIAAPVITTKDRRDLRSVWRRALIGWRCLL